MRTYDGMFVRLTDYEHKVTKDGDWKPAFLAAIAEAQRYCDGRVKVDRILRFTGDGTMR